MNKKIELYVYISSALILAAGGVFLSNFFSIFLFIFIVFLVYKNYKAKKKMENFEKEKLFLTEKFLIMEERNRLLLSSEDKMVVFYDSDFNIIAVNKCFSEVFDYRNEKNIFKLLQKKVKNSEKLLQKEEFLKTNNSVSSTYLELFFENRKVYKADFKSENGREKLLIMEDITEFKRSNATFELILQNVNEAVAMISKELKIIKCNTEFKDFFLYHEGIEMFPGAIIGSEMGGNTREFWQNILKKAATGEKVILKANI